MEIARLVVIVWGRIYISTTNHGSLHVVQGVWSSYSGSTHTGALGLHKFAHIYMLFICVCVYLLDTRKVVLAKPPGRDIREVDTKSKVVSTLWIDISCPVMSQPGPMFPCPEDLFILCT